MRKTLFKAMAIGKRDQKSSQNSSLRKERAGEVLRAGVEKIIGHLCLLIDLTLRKSKFS